MQRQNIGITFLKIFINARHRALKFQHKNMDIPFYRNRSFLRYRYGSGNQKYKRICKEIDYAKKKKFNFFRRNLINWILK